MHFRPVVIVGLLTSHDPRRCEDSYTKDPLDSRCKKDNGRKNEIKRLVIICSTCLSFIGYVLCPLDPHADRQWRICNDAMALECALFKLVKKTELSRASWPAKFAPPRRNMAPPSKFWASLERMVSIYNFKRVNNYYKLNRENI